MANMIQDFSSLAENSAAHPAPKCDVSAQFRSLKECKTWLEGVPSHKILESKPLQRIREAIAILQARPSRQQRQTIQQLLRDWDVPPRKLKAANGNSTK